jgi:hypothetical protein
MRKINELEAFLFYRSYRCVRKCDNSRRYAFIHPSGSFLQVSIRDNVISFKNISCFVANYHHGDPLWHSCPYKVADSGTAKVVTELTRKLGIPASIPPCNVRIAYPFPVSMEDIRVLKGVSQVFLPLLVENTLKHLRESDNTARFVLVSPAIETYCLSFYIYPRQL